MLGWVAAVRATESPSQLSPALIHSTWIRVSSACTGFGRRHQAPHFRAGSVPSSSARSRTVRPRLRRCSPSSTRARRCVKGHIGQVRLSEIHAFHWRSSPRSEPRPAASRRRGGADGHRAPAEPRRSRRTGAGPTLFTTTRSAAANMWGYFSGLSSPSVTEITTPCAPRRGRTGPGRPGCRRSRRTRDRPRRGPAGLVRVDHRASRWQPEPVFTCTARAPATLIRSASKRVSWSPSITETGLADSAIVRSSNGGLA